MEPPSKPHLSKRKSSALIIKNVPSSDSIIFKDPHLVIGEDAQTDSELYSKSIGQRNTMSCPVYAEQVIEQVKSTVSTGQEPSPEKSQENIPSTSDSKSRQPWRHDPWKKESLFFKKDCNDHFWYYNCFCFSNSCEATQSEALDCFCQTAGLPCFLLGQLLCGQNNRTNLVTPCMRSCTSCISCDCTTLGRLCSHSVANCLDQSVCCCSLYTCIQKMFPFL